MTFFRISDFLSAFFISLSLIYLYYHICRFLSFGKVNIFSIVFSSIFYSMNISHQYQHGNPNYHKKWKSYVNQVKKKVRNSYHFRNHFLFAVNISIRTPASSGSRSLEQSSPAIRTGSDCRRTDAMIFSFNVKEISACCRKSRTRCST